MRAVTDYEAWVIGGLLGLIGILVGLVALLSADLTDAGRLCAGVVSIGLLATGGAVVKFAPRK